MEFLEDKLLQYIEDNTEQEPEVLKKLYRETYANVLVPRMIAGHYQGRVISMLSKMIKPKQILEIGTYTGYSAICWAEGLVAGGMVHSIDINEEIKDMVDRYIEEAGIRNNVTQYIGNALSIIPQINETFDIVYIDADKENYSNYFDEVIDKVHAGGFIIADNVLWSGKVLETSDTRDEDTEALVAYSKKIREDDRVENVLLPIRDGLLVARKK
ncbi:MAG TPA: O-methyltransferase [Flavobacteriales bacterium]|nr:O-methyltransferase [Flavobacteriales bacterium]HIA11883.1 O-methyltransferase [Flavobacteriales bacterium]